MSFFFPFPLSFILYIGDNVNFKYGGGERHLHEEFKKKMFSKSYNLHVRVIWVFLFWSLFLFFLSRYYPSLWLVLSWNMSHEKYVRTRRCMLEQIRDIATKLLSTWISWWFAWISFKNIRPQHKSKDRLDWVILMMNMSLEIMIEALISTFMIDICDDNMIEAPI